MVVDCGDCVVIGLFVMVIFVLQVIGGWGCQFEGDCGDLGDCGDRVGGSWEWDVDGMLDSSFLGLGYDEKEKE